MKISEVLAPGLLSLRKVPDPVLRLVCEKVDLADPYLRKFADAMIEMMHVCSGVGLAAPQVGASVSMFVANPRLQSGSDLVIINPEILSVAQETSTQIEGCLSIPSFRRNVTRPTSVIVRYWDLEGKELCSHWAGPMARLALHEIDHLKGKLIWDK
jgi:peptide deformylase